MTTPTGTITMVDIQTEFGGAPPIALDEYYAGGLYVPAGTPGVPSSDRITMDDLRGKTKFVPVTVTVTPSSTAEGNSFTISFSTTQVLYTTIYWKLTDYSNLTADDFVTTSGSATHNGSQYPNVTLTTQTDDDYEGPGTFRVTVYADSGYVNELGQSSTLTVTDSYTVGSVNLSRTQIYRYANLDASYRVSQVTVNISGLQGATIYYEIYTTTSGQTLTSSDVDSPASLTGTFTAASSQLFLNVRAAEWNPNSPVLVDKTVVVRFRLGSASGTILATSANITLYRSPQFGATWSPSTINEGQTSRLTVSMTYIPVAATNPPVSVFFTSTTGSYPSTASLINDFETFLPGGNTDSGSIGFTQNTLQIDLTAKQDGILESAEILYLTFRKSSTTGTAFYILGDNPAANPPLTIAAPTYAIAPNTTSVTESGSVTFTVTTTSFGSGTLYWSLEAVSGTVNSSDFITSLTGSVSISNNSGSFTVTLNPDETTEGTESFRARLRSGSTSGTILATSSTITIFDTSETPAPPPPPPLDPYLVLSIGGSNSSGSVRTVYAQLFDVTAVSYSRNFSIDWAFKTAGSATWGSWSTFGPQVTIPANSTSSSNTLMYTSPPAAAQFDVKIRCVALGIESNILYNVWLA